MFNLFFKTLRDKRFFILGWSVGLMFLGFLMTSFYPSFSGGQIDGLLETLPPALQGLVGNLQDWRELPGYIGSQVFDIRLPIFISILSILLAIGITVGEEDKGQLRTLIALPISRRKIILAKWAGMVGICLVASIAPIIGVELGLLAINQTLDQMVLVRLGVFTWLLVTGLATVIFAIGLSTGKRSITTGVAIILSIGSFLLSTFARAVDWLKDYDNLSFFHYFPAVDIAKGTVEWGNTVFYVAAILIALLITLIVFPRRDVKSS
ncbi:MAG: ABC transporter permease subunit [Candidatus Saccharimonadaceae bacterium]